MDQGPFLALLAILYVLFLVGITLAVIKSIFRNPMKWLQWIAAIIIAVVYAHWMGFI